MPHWVEASGRLASGPPVLTDCDIPGQLLSPEARGPAANAGAASTPASRASDAAEIVNLSTAPSILR